MPVMAPHRRMRLVTAVGIALVLAIGGLWVSGGFSDLAALAMAAQQRFQNQMALVLRQLKQGAPGAWGGLMLLCYGYGFLHAAGPGHGKVLISGYGIGARTRLVPLVGISLAASLAQAAVAVALAYGGLLVLLLTRDQVLGAAGPSSGWISAGVMVLIGGVLIWRGGAGLRDYTRQTGHGGHGGHNHSPGESCSHCGHSHGPDAAEIAAVTSWRDAALLVGAVAMRPCSGALMLLVLTWQMGVGWSGIAGAFVMALGTATVGIAVAALAVFARTGVLAWVAQLGWTGIALPVIQLLAGGAVVLLALGMAALP